MNFSVKQDRWDDSAREYDAVLFLSFGGPEGPEDVIPFLENVTRGRGIPRERLDEVSHHYLHFGGVSPINQQNRDLIEALRSELLAHQIELPIYFGNRNWNPFLKDTILKMMDAGVERCLVFVTSAMSSYSGCRQYREDIARAVEEIGNCEITFDKIRVFYNHPGFVGPVTDLLQQAVSNKSETDTAATAFLFSAHSIPESMARKSAYEVQLREASRLVAEAAGLPSFEIVFQSRSGSPLTPWLEPDVLDVIRERRAQGIRRIVIVPIGFISDHMEVLFDLDTEAAELCAELGLELIRVPTVGTHPQFVGMIRELIEERMSDNPVRAALGERGPNHDFCPLECCLIGSTGRPATA